MTVDELTEFSAIALSNSSGNAANGFSPVIRIEVLPDAGLSVRMTRYTSADVLNLTDAGFSVKVRGNGALEVSTGGEK